MGNSSAGLVKGVNLIIASLSVNGGRKSFKRSTASRVGNQKTLRIFNLLTYFFKKPPNEAKASQLCPPKAKGVSGLAGSFLLLRRMFVVLLLNLRHYINIIDHIISVLKQKEC